MIADQKTGIGDEYIPVFRELGYDYIELPLAQVTALSEEEFSKLVARINQGGIPVEACNNFFPAHIRITGHDADLTAAAEYARRACDRAVKMGARLIGFGSSGAKNIPEGFPLERAYAQCVDLLCQLQDIAAPLGIFIAIEPLNSAESNFILNGSEGLDMVRAVSRPNIQLELDYYHMRMENESLDVIKAAGGTLRHAHIAAKEGRLFPASGDGENYAGFLKALRDIGYDGRVSVEAYSRDVPTDAAEALALLRPMTLSHI